MLKKIKPFNVFKEEADKIFQNKFVYDESTYQGFSKKFKITCTKHGDFLTSPEVFLKLKYGCPKCGKEESVKSNTDSYANLIEQSQKVHNFKYDYSLKNKETYINKKSIINIFCPTHGVFRKKAQKHLAGQGCYHCKIQELVNKNILVGGYSEFLFKEKPDLKSKPSRIYLLKINEYYKIGITTKDVNNRIKEIKSKAKKKGENINCSLILYEELPLYESFKKEQKILEENSEFRIFKKWSTELLKQIDIEKYF